MNFLESVPIALPAGKSATVSRKSSAIALAGLAKALPVTLVAAEAAKKKQRLGNAPVIAGNRLRGCRHVVEM